MPDVSQIVVSAATTYGVPPSIALAQAQQESSMNPAAYNPKSGATGLFQLMPGTATQLGVTNPLDPVQSANGGQQYLAQLYAQFGSWELALAAYDWGPGNLQKDLNANGANWFAFAPAETQNYVISIMGAAGSPYTTMPTSPVPVPAALTPVPDFSNADADQSGMLVPVAADDSSFTNALSWVALAVGGVLGFNLIFGES